MKSFFQRFIEWLAICSICAIPSFLFALQDYSLSGMITGVVFFSLAYAAITGTSWFQTIQHWPGVRVTLFIGYGTRLAISLLSLLFFLSGSETFQALIGFITFIDLALGMLSLSLVNSFPLFDPTTQFVGTLITTLLQGMLINIVLLVYMAVIYGVIRSVKYTHPDGHRTTDMASTILTTPKEELQRVRQHKVTKIVLVILILLIGLLWYSFSDSRFLCESHISPDGRFLLEKWDATAPDPPGSQGGCSRSGHIRLRTREGELLHEAYSPILSDLMRVEWSEEKLEFKYSARDSTSLANWNLPQDIPIPPEYRQNYLQYRLNRAVQHNDVELAQHYLQQGALINASDSLDEYPLLVAAAFRQEKVIAFLLATGADIAIRNKKGETVLHMADADTFVTEDESPAIALLLDNGADINAKDTMGTTPLHVQRQFKEVQLLVERGADLNARDNENKTPLSTYAGYPEILSYLLNQGAQYSVSSKEVDEIVWEAVGGGQLETVQYFIERGADVNARIHPGKYNEETHLYRAIYFGHEDIAKYLISKGANVNVGTPDTTPLHLAVYFTNVEMVKYLVDHGADVNQPDSSGYTTLKRAKQGGADRQRLREIKDYLEAHGGHL